MKLIEKGLQSKKLYLACFCWLIHWHCYGLIFPKVTFLLTEDPNYTTESRGRRRKKRSGREPLPPDRFSLYSSLSSLSGGLTIFTTNSDIHKVSTIVEDNTAVDKVHPLMVIDILHAQLNQIMHGWMDGWCKEPSLQNIISVFFMWSICVIEIQIINTSNFFAVKTCGFIVPICQAHFFSPYPGDPPPCGKWPRVDVLLSLQSWHLSQKCHSTCHWPPERVHAYQSIR